ncbi:acetyl-CoA acetyltransferase [Nitriliruptoraceae bacterium ZYF776]|nr:acetyl-CoA acetyltransferase [Profundirhabdus halotolerans]
MDDNRLPVIVAVGEAVGDRGRDPDRAREPSALLDDALAAVREDLDATDPDAFLAALDAVYAVRTTSWAYASMAGRVADRLGAAPGHRVDTTVGGHWPVRLLEEAAARIAAGEDRGAVLVGAEAQAALGALQRAGRDPIADAGWSADPGGPPAFDPDDLGSPGMQASGLFLPTRVYPSVHLAWMADRGLDPATAGHRSAALYAAFTELAADHPIAWNRTRRSAEDVATVGAGNRMVCEPYPLAVNAMPHVDQAAAVVLTSAAVARVAGIPEDRWVHVHGGAGATDPNDVLARRRLGEADGLRLALDRTLDRTGWGADDLDVVDVYSCFPIVPELVREHLGLGSDHVPSVTGGHAAFGGPLSSYSLHAVAAVTRRLRGTGGRALVHGNGGYLTHHHAVVLAAAAHVDGYVGDPVPTAVTHDAPTWRPATEVATAEGTPVTIEAWTVEHAKQGGPAQAFVVARTADGARTAAATAPGDTTTAAALSLNCLPAGATTHVGRTVHLVHRDGQAVVDPGASP